MVTEKQPAPQQPAVEEKAEADADDAGHHTNVCLPMKSMADATITGLLNYPPAKRSTPASDENDYESGSATPPPPMKQHKLSSSPSSRRLTTIRKNVSVTGMLPHAYGSIHTYNSLLLDKHDKVLMGSSVVDAVDRHSCMAAPYAPQDPVTIKYFELVISMANAPVVCGYAGKLKGKAIYADKDIAANEHIWTEPPFVAMQLEHNKRDIASVPCCQYCFMPLFGQYRQTWREMVARTNYNNRKDSSSDSSMNEDVQALDQALELLGVEPKTCGLMQPAVICSCGDTYCSKLCQLRAYHEFHGILCPRDVTKPTAMNMFMEHIRATNDIFFLAAKVVARILSRYFITRDIIKAREPMDMFYKKPWWALVRVDDTHMEINDKNGSPPPNEEYKNMTNRPQEIGKLEGKQLRDLSLSDKEEKIEHNNKSNYFQQAGDAAKSIDGANTYGHVVHPEDKNSKMSSEEESNTKAQAFKTLLTHTHELLLAALECNLVQLEREDQLHGLLVEDIWTSCTSILSFEFFAAQLGLFEMNNICMEIDHPFHALKEILDPDDGASGIVFPPGKDASILSRVRQVLQLDVELQAQQALERYQQQDDRPVEGFVGIEGTALFPIICTMNHSCDPNCTVLYTKNGDAYVVSVRGIKKGEELCICYIDIDQDVLQREALLRDYQFKCYCTRCCQERQALKQQGTTPNQTESPTDTQMIPINSSPAMLR